MAKIKPEDKGTHMAAIGADYAGITKASADVDTLREQGAAKIEAIVKKHGPGPFIMPVPQADGTSVDFIVTFRKDGKAWATTTVRADSVTRPDGIDAVGLDYAVISGAKGDVHKLEVLAAPKIKDVMASFGPGPHKMPVPKPDGSGNQDMIVNFRKDGDVFAASAVPADSIT